MYLPYGQLQDRSHVSSRDQNNSPKAACGPAVQKTDQHTVAEAALELDIHATAAVAWPDELSHYSCAAREITSRSFLRVSFCDATWFRVLCLVGLFISSSHAVQN